MRGKLKNLGGALEGAPIEKVGEVRDKEDGVIISVKLLEDRFPWEKGDVVDVHYYEVEYEQ